MFELATQNGGLAVQPLSSFGVPKLLTPPLRLHQHYKRMDFVPL